MASLSLPAHCFQTWPKIRSPYVEMLLASFFEPEQMAGRQFLLPLAAILLAPRRELLADIEAGHLASKQLQEDMRR